MQKLPIGLSDFKELRMSNYYFVDKSEFISEVINENNKVILITRPRRFGKTLNLSMLKYFLALRRLVWNFRSTITIHEVFLRLCLK